MNHRTVNISKCVLVALAVVVGGCWADSSGGGTGTRTTNGTGGSKLTLNPAQLDFGRTTVGVPAERWVQVRNTDTKSIRVNSVVPTQNKDELQTYALFTTDCDGKDRTDADIKEIAPGTCAQFAVNWAPQKTGGMLGNVRLTLDGNFAPIDLPISGNGVSGTLEYCILNTDGTVDTEKCSRLADDPPFLPTVDFGTMIAGENKKASIRITNRGEGALVISDANIVPDALDLELSERFQPVTIQPNSRVELKLEFQPTTDALRKHVLALETNDPIADKLEIPIQAVVNGPRICLDPLTTADFGSVPAGASFTRTVTIGNCGTVPFFITNLATSKTDASNGSFVIAQGAPNLPIALTAGQQFQIGITYSPSVVQTAPVTIDNGTLTVTALNQIATLNLTGKGIVTSCGSQLPVANLKVTSAGSPIDPNTTPVRPLQTVSFDATASTPAIGVQYQWRLVSQPPNGTASLIGTGAKTDLYMPVSGDYSVELTVLSSQCQSAPKLVTVHAVPAGKVHFELTWAELTGNLDLHYVGPGGALMQLPGNSPEGDLFWRYAPARSSHSPDWGASNSVFPDNRTDDDALFDIDQPWGRGPEMVTHATPFDGTYQVFVHYECSRLPMNGGYGTSSGTATATLAVYVDGLKRFELRSPPLTQRDVWNPAQISISGGGSNVTVIPGSTPLAKIAQGCTVDSQ